VDAVTGGDVGGRKVGCDERYAEVTVLFCGVAARVGRTGGGVGVAGILSGSVGTGDGVLRV
jgi:hypothetical protein